MSALLDLAARVEGATGADRDLFEAAYTAINGRSWALAAYQHGSLGKQPDFQRQQSAMRFGELLSHAAWLDAAMSLVPEGWTWDVDATVPSLGIDWTLHHPTDIGCRERGSSEHPALALCAAALRARAAIEASS